ncbi:MAG: hypothetical protein ACRC7G_16940 [Beijerinckiaceae bacterium]
MVIGSTVQTVFQSRFHETLAIRMAFNVRPERSHYGIVQHFQKRAMLFIDHRNAHGVESLAGNR